MNGKVNGWAFSTSPADIGGDNENRASVPLTQAGIISSARTLKGFERVDTEGVNEGVRR
jgi:hypothetical protein